MKRFGSALVHSSLSILCDLILQNWVGGYHAYLLLFTFMYLNRC